MGLRHVSTAAQHFPAARVDWHDCGQSDEHASTLKSEVARSRLICTLAPSVPEVSVMDLHIVQGLSCMLRAI